MSDTFLFLEKDRKEYCLTWTAGRVGDEGGLATGRGSSSDAAGASQ